jgi:plastocyanin
VSRLLLLTVLALAFVAGRGEGAETPRLVGTVGPGFTIDLADASGAHVNSLVAGRYELLMHDLSDEHNFVLGSKTTGQRLAQTEVPFIGDLTFTVDLAPGFYVYACSPHFQTMNGSFTVVSSTPAPAPQTKSLAATVDARRASLSRTRAAPGGYRITVADRSRTRNFHLAGPGVDRRTGKPFTGTVTWTVRLRVGTYRFGSDPKLLGRLIVAP